MYTHNVISKCYECGEEEEEENKENEDQVEPKTNIIEFNTKDTLSYSWVMRRLMY